jgi:hypothetical protein
MSARYASALEEIRAILASRTQAQPLLEAADVWDELTCWPIPSLRTIRRFVEQIRAESEAGHDGHPHGHRGQTAQNGVVSP